MDTTLTLRPALGRHAAEAPDTLLRLTADATLAGHLPVGACVAVQSGCIWLTQTGDANDYVIDAGQRHVVTRAGRIVVESLAPHASLRVLREPSAARPGFP